MDVDVLAKMFSEMGTGRIGVARGGPLHGDQHLEASGAAQEVSVDVGVQGGVGRRPGPDDARRPPPRPGITRFLVANRNF